ncbi:MAG TPA: polysaccharide pyruvyl transferase family protein [Bryobacteraceae bacterium]
MGGGNLGDDATQSAVIQNIKARWPDVEIALFSMNPADTAPRHGVAAYPIRTETWNRHEKRGPGSPPARWRQRILAVLPFLRTLKAATAEKLGPLWKEIRFLANALRVIRSFDLLVVSGGGQLLDSWGGPWKFPYTIFKWTLLAKLSGARCYFLNVGAGPLTHPKANWFIRRALALADYVSFRDENSRDLAQTAGFQGKAHIAADCVYALDVSALPSHDVARKDGPVVGLSPMAYGDPRVYWQKNQAVYESLIGNVVRFGDWLREHHYNLSLFSTDIWFDLPTLEEVRSRLETSNGHRPRGTVNQEHITTVGELLSRISSMDYIVTCRFHGVVFAHLLNKPVLALSHHPKVATLMSDLGLSKYCVDIHRCDAAALQDTFLSLVAEREDIKSRMAERASGYRTALAAQFDHLFSDGVRA